ncbi:prevent-host-death family protein [Deferribacter desulfuricans SSM1]|uniref:Prevent-host-death family protein n=1 Tax=Deferribacter desulfuricans (strain DSM 14783 / JCM 11476 / NBRC 101012 / SSM1) TaxID=639282 RepID=D3PBB1_DEFDS|nr:type II toxin-antitoxin system prevent-host-death family antitoxin [Deferribacter desulfuricans]BAI79884.1 prevent-host-death family protein [Deferribacter desulfuricans SSM1]
MIITANELKRRGVSLIDSLIKKFDEVIISVRGKQKYVVLDIDRYEKLRNSEIEIAYLNVVKDLENNRYHTDIESYIKNISK